MKTVKQVVTCLLLFCLFCGLSACNKQTDPGSDWIWAYQQRGAFSDKGYYFVGSGFLQFVDTTSGARVCLCSKVGCLHDQEPDHRISENCEAFLAGAHMLTPLFFWDDHLYYILQDHYGTHVYRRDATGAGLETVATLGEKYIEDQKEVTVSSYAVIDGFLYYSARVEGSIPAADGGNIVQRISDYLGRLELQTGKEEILLEKNDVHITLSAVKSNEVLFYTAGVPDADFKDPNYRQKFLKMPATLQHWDGKTGQVRTLFEKTIQEFASVNIIEDDKLYYAGTSDSGYGVHTYDLNTGKQDVVGPDVLRHIGKGYALKYDPDKEQWRLYNLNTKKELPNAVNKGFMIEAISDIGFVMRRTVDAGSAGHLRVFSYVKYVSLADGLQEEDLLDFYSESTTTGNS